MTLLIMHSTMKLSVLLLLLLFTTTVHGELLKKFKMGSMEKNKNSNNKQEEPAMTCDAMMAKSLVAANEATAMAQSERDQFFLDLERMTATAQELEQELQETTQDLTQRLFSAKQDLNDKEQQHQQALQTLESTWQAKLQDENDNMALLRDRSERAIQELQQDARDRIAAWQKERDASLLAKNEEMEQTKLHYEELATAVRAQAAQNITSVMTKAELQTRSLQEQHDKHVTLLQEEMKLQQTKSDALLQQTKQESQNRLKELKDAYQTEFSKMRTDCMAKLKETNDEHELLKQELKTLEKKNDDLQKRYNAASEVSCTGITCLRYSVLWIHAQTRIW